MHSYTVNRILCTVYLSLSLYIYIYVKVIEHKYYKTILCGKR